MTARQREEGPGSKRRRRWPWVAGLAVVLGGLWVLITDAYREEEKELRTQLREAVKERFPEETEALRQRITTRFNCQEIVVLDDLGPVCGTHGGPGSLGVGSIPWVTDGKLRVLGSDARGKQHRVAGEPAVQRLTVE